MHDQKRRISVCGKQAYARPAQPQHGFFSGCGSGSGGCCCCICFSSGGRNQHDGFLCRRLLYATSQLCPTSSKCRPTQPILPGHHPVAAAAALHGYARRVLPEPLLHWPYSPLGLHFAASFFRFHSVTSSSSSSTAARPSTSCSSLLPPGRTTGAAPEPAGLPRLFPGRSSSFVALQSCLGQCATQHSICIILLTVFFLCSCSTACTPGATQISSPPASTTRPASCAPLKVQPQCPPCLITSAVTSLPPHSPTSPLQTPTSALQTPPLPPASPTAPREKSALPPPTLS